jgi:deoxyribonuclease (pyrimidine dimer)
MLADQHLIAELKEINQLAGGLSNTLAGVQEKEIPETFRLGSGHVKFFYNKGMYLSKRFDLLKQEMSDRGFKPTAAFTNVWRERNRPELFKDWAPNEKDYSVIKERLLEKVQSKPGFYRYRGCKISLDEYREILANTGV